MDFLKQFSSSFAFKRLIISKKISFLFHFPLMKQYKPVNIINQTFIYLLVYQNRQTS